MSASCQPEIISKRREKLALGIGIAYLALMACRIPLGHTFYAEDLLAPLLAVVVLWRWRSRLLKLDAPTLMLGLFLGLSAIATLTHPLPFPGNVYHWCVFAYLALVFLFFRDTFFPARAIFWLSTLFLTVALLACFHDLVVSSLHSSAVRFSFVSPQMEQSSLPFLRQRFTLHFGNPNLFASFHALALALFFLSGQQILPIQSLRLRLRLTLCVVGLLFCLPLIFSISKHGLLSLALFSHFSASLLSSPPMWHRIFQWLPLLLVALIFELSVLFPVFPLQSSWPFINNRCQGMYMIHQTAYARMASNTPVKLLLGHGAENAKKQYADFTNKEKAEQTLKYYNASKDLDNFVAFMEPHNEYLRLLVIFGLPATLAMMGFWTSLIKTKHPKAMAGFAVAVLICCLWDDLLSKRWIWITGAMILSCQQNWTAKTKDVNGNQQ